jgi:hypothetical protein
MPSKRRRRKPKPLTQLEVITSIRKELPPVHQIHCDRKRAAKRRRIKRVDPHLNGDDLPIP